MNNLDDLIAIIRASYPEFAVVMRAEPQDGKSKWFANIIHATCPLRDLEKGKTKFPVTSEVSMLDALQTCYYWICAYTINGTVIIDVKDVPKGPTLST